MPIPYHECPSFLNCSVNVCPLDPNASDRNRITGEPKCRAEKPTRMRIGAKYPDLLRFVGLTRREFLARKAWDALPTDKKEIRLQGLIKARNTLNHPTGGIV